MKRNPLTQYLDVEEFVLLGYLLGLAVYAVFIDHDSPAPEPWDEQQIRLGEDHLRRLEDGETLRVERWHGHSVELSADLVVDAEQAEEAEAE